MKVWRFKYCNITHGSLLSLHFSSHVLINPGLVAVSYTCTFFCFVLFCSLGNGRGGESIYGGFFEGISFLSCISFPLG